MAKVKTQPMEETEPVSEGVTEQDVVSEVLTDYKRAYSHKQQKDVLFRSIYERYRSYLNVTNEATRSNLFIPESFTLVETISPRMTASKPSFKILPRESSDVTNADIHATIIDYQYDRIGLQRKIKSHVRQGLIYGTSVLKVGWDFEKHSPMVIVIDIGDIFPDPDTEYWEEGFVIHRYWKDPADLKRSKIKYDHLDELEKLSNTTAVDDTLRQDRATIQGLPYDGNKEGIEIIEEWKFVDGKVRIRTIAGRQTLIRDAVTPLPLNELPFIPFFDQEVGFEKWGIGEIEPIMDLQDEENTIRNQRVDEKNLSIHNMWVVSKLAGVDYKTLVSKPGGVILANDVNGIVPLVKQNITADSVIELNMIKDDIRNTTGVNDIVRGISPKGVNTATETVTLSQQASNRFGEKVNNLELCLKKLGEWMVAMNSKFLFNSSNKELILRITGKYGLEVKKITAKDIEGQFDVSVASGSSLPANPDLRRQQLRELTQVLQPILTNQNGIPEGMRELVRVLIQAYDLKNADEILQGAQHPLVGQAIANLQDGEMKGINPRMVEAEIKRKLMGTGALNPAMQATNQNQPGQANAAEPPQLPSPVPIPSVR